MLRLLPGFVNKPAGRNRKPKKLPKPGTNVFVRHAVFEHQTILQIGVESSVCGRKGSLRSRGTNRSHGGKQCRHESANHWENGLEVKFLAKYIAPCSRLVAKTIHFASRARVVRGAGAGGTAP